MSNYIDTSFNILDVVIFVSADSALSSSVCEHNVSVDNVDFQPGVKQYVWMCGMLSSWAEVMTQTDLTKMSNAHLKSLY